jgi:protein TonB
MSGPSTYRRDALSGSDTSPVGRLIRGGAFILAAIVLHSGFIGAVVGISTLIGPPHVDKSDESSQVEVSVNRVEPEEPPEPPPEPESLPPVKPDPSRVKQQKPEKPTKSAPEPKKVDKRKKPALPPKKQPKPKESTKPKKEANPVDLDGLTMESTSKSSDGPKIKVGKGIETGKMNQDYVDPDTLDKKRRRRAESGAPESSGTGVNPTKDCTDTDPEPIDKYRVPENQYPAEAKRRGLSGTVRAILTVDKEGDVSKVQLVSKAGHGFDQLARKAFRKWRFKPARQNCRPVEAEVGPVVHEFRISE